MAKKIILFALILGVSTQVYSQDKSEVNIAQLRDQAISYTMDAINSYNKFYSTQNKSYLIDGIKYASKANALFDVYIKIEKVPKDSDLILMTNGISRYANTYAEELINVRRGSFEVNNGQVRANNNEVAQIIMHSFTNAEILKRWFKGWKKRNYEN